MQIFVVIQIKWKCMFSSKKCVRASLCIGERSHRITESCLSVVYPGQHIWKLQYDERASGKGKRGTKNKAKGIGKIKKRGNLPLWCNSQEKICLIFCFLTWMFFLQVFNAFTKWGSLWSAELNHISVIFQVRDELHSYSLFAGISSEGAFLRWTLREAECLIKTHQTKISAVATSGQSASSPSLEMKNRKQQKHWELRQTWIQTNFWLRGKITKTDIVKWFLYLVRVQSKHPASCLDIYVGSTKSNTTYVEILIWMDS